MASHDDGSLQSLHDFAARYVGRELTQGERDHLSSFAAALAAAPAQPQAAARHPATDVIEAERRRVQAAISQMLAGVEEAVRREMQSQQAMEAAALRAVEASRSLEDLRPSTLRKSQPGEIPPEQLLIAQIADRLANLVRAEVDACFDRRFGPAQQQAPATPAASATPAAPATPAQTPAAPPPSGGAQAGTAPESQA